MALKSYIRFGIQISVTVCVCANNRQIMRNRMSLTLPNEIYVTIKRVFKFECSIRTSLRVSSHRSSHLTVQTHTERERESERERRHMLTIPKRRRHKQSTTTVRWIQLTEEKKIYLLDFTFISIQYLIKQKPEERKKECDSTDQQHQHTKTTTKLITKTDTKPIPFDRSAFLENSQFFSHQFSNWFEVCFLKKFELLKWRILVRQIRCLEVLSLTPKRCLASKETALQSCSQSFLFTNWN